MNFLLRVPAHSRRLLGFPLLLVALLLCAGAAQGDEQDGSARDLFPKLGKGFGGQSGFGGGFGGFDMADPVTWSASAIETPLGPKLQITAEPQDSWYVYSVTQKSGGPLPTKFEIVKPKGLKPTSGFVPDKKPKSAPEPVFGNLTVEKHKVTTVWTASLPKDVDRSQALRVRVQGQACQDGGGCIPINETLTAKWIKPKNPMSKPNVAPEMAGKPFRDTEYVVDWTAKLRPASVTPGDAAVLEITAKPDKDYHVYQAATDDSETSTNFLASEKSGLQVGTPRTAAKTIEKRISDAFPPFVYHPGEVTWQIPIVVPKDIDPGDKRLVFQIAYLACQDTSCLPPRGLRLETTLNVAKATAAKASAAKATAANPGNPQFEWTAIKSVAVLDGLAGGDWVDDMNGEAVIRAALKTSRETDGDADKNDSGDEETIVASGGDSGSRGDSGSGGDSGSAAGDPDLGSGDASTDPAGSDSLVLTESSTTNKMSLLAMITFGFLGGMILNVMPCVLPVIGLKVMSFISQAGEDRGRILALNLAYVAGIFGVFILLATAGAFFGLAWGEQFQNFGLRMTATIGLFAFALSYLGVWEIPAPGMVSSKAGQKLQSQEGLMGAMGKGVFATILATPCSAPLLGGVFSGLAGAGPMAFYIVFLSIAAGMSFPYVVIGFVPAAAAWLPKPGTWMEKFKEFMAFIMLFSTAFFFYQFSDENKLKVFITLIGVWLGCWIMGQVPAWDSLRKRVVAGVGGVVTATLVGLASFTYIGGPQDLDWQDYSDVVLAEHQKQGKTVLVDFSAKWCATCIYNVERVIDTPEVAKVVEELDVVPIYADWTNYDPEITEKLAELRSRSIPVLAIYPAGQPDRPIVLRDVVTKKQVIAALRQAGPSLERATVSRNERSVARLSEAEWSVSSPPLRGGMVSK